MKETGNSPTDIQMFKLSYPARHSKQIGDILQFIHTQCPSHTSVELNIPEFTLEAGKTVTIGLGTRNSIKTISEWLRKTEIDISGIVQDFTDQPNA